MALAHEVLASRSGSQGCAPAGYGRRARYRQAKREGGAFAIMLAAVLLGILGFCALALDLGMAYNRKVELHGVAKAVALAAARELNGTTAGVTAAVTKAEATAKRFKYKYGVSIPWAEAAITFSTSPLPGADWVDASTAKGAPAGRYYVKVNTNEFGAGVSTVETLFFHLISSSPVPIVVSDRAVAGRTAINVTPLAVCAMSTTPRAPRTNVGPPSTVELVEYGFRRGVGYDLMQLNPHGASAANFVVDPVFQPGGSGMSTHTSAAAVGQFVCTGTMWMPRVTGGAIRVASPFPLADLYRQLNSRFDEYDGGLCSANGAPPDYNIKAYAHDVANGVPWMSPTPTAHHAALDTATAGKVQTILDLPSPTSGAVASYGPLWSYARAARYAATEPSSGDTTFAAADWASLYHTSLSAPAYPTSFSANTPYLATSGTNYRAPDAARLPISKEHRRVLHVPLLSCDPAPSGSGVSATVLAVGKFFMTTPATTTRISAEFAGVVSEKSLTGRVELYP